MAKQFSEMLRKFRERSGFSQRALANKANIDASYINKLESGEREVTSRAMALRLAQILQLSPDETDLWLSSANYISPRLQYIISKFPPEQLHEMSKEHDVELLTQNESDNRQPALNTEVSHG